LFLSFLAFSSPVDNLINYVVHNLQLKKNKTISQVCMLVLRLLSGMCRNSLRWCNYSVIGGLFTVMAVGSGACFTTASAITGKYSEQTVTNWNTAGFATATAVAVTPLTLTNIVRVLLGRASTIRMTRQRRFLFFYFAFLAAILISCVTLRF